MGKVSEIKSKCMEGESRCESRTMNNDNQNINKVRKDMYDVSKELGRLEVVDPGKAKVIKAIRKKMEKLSEVMFKLANAKSSKKKITPRGFEVLK